MMNPASEDVQHRAFSIREVCRITGLGRSTIFASIKSGALLARKCGRRTIILSADLDVFLRNLSSAAGGNKSGRDDVSNTQQLKFKGF
jgi:excisionase family DNA binding protein